MTAALQLSGRVSPEITVEKSLQKLLRLAARELGLSRKQAEEAAYVGTMRIDGVQVSISCLETDVQQDAVVVAKLNVPVHPAAIRQLLEINLVAVIAMGSTIAIDCDGGPILLALVPVAASGPVFLANHISQMVLFANTLHEQVAR